MRGDSVRFDAGPDGFLLCRYILRFFQWARKYGLRVYLDLHTAPGSQNGKYQALPPFVS